MTKNTMPQKISAAILTYGERLALLYQSVDQLQTQEFHHIYIYCNGITTSNFEKIRAKYNNNRTSVIYSDTNLGSAGGYHELIKYASSIDATQYLLLLDDDNLIADNFIHKATPLLKNSDNITFINRANRKVLTQARDLKQPGLVLGTKNSFLGRDILKNVCSSYEITESDLIAAPYSGLILPPSVLQKSLLPNKDFFLYVDDHEYTFRLVTKYGYKISLVTDIEIIDLEDSFHLNTKNNGFLSNRYINAEKFRLFYSVRNQFYFGLNRCDNKYIFTANVIIISTYMTIGFLIRGKFKQIGWFFSAIKNGFTLKGEN